MPTYLPKSFTNKAIFLYIFLLFICYIVFQQPLPVLWAIFGLLEVIVFFGFTNGLTRKWCQISQKTYEKRLFTSAFVIRICWVLLSYILFIYMTGTPFEFHSQDAMLYHLRASANTANPFSFLAVANISDSGYVVYLSIIYKIFTNVLWIPRLIKALISAYTCLLIYRLASRNFGDAAGRISGVMAMLMPNLIYYCGLHLKETEMVFIIVLFVERADYLFRTKRFSIINVAVPLLCGMLLFSFRTILGVVAFLSFFVAVIFSSKRVISLNRRLAALVALMIFFIYSFGSRIQFDVNQYWQDRETNQASNMMARTQRRGESNTLAKYGNSAIFLPAIIPAPFPTLVNIKEQDNIMMLNGGFFVRNIFAFFVFFALFLMFKRKILKDYIFILSILFGYLFILALSAFAISERFHLPAVPFLLILAGYGTNQLNKKSLKYYNLYLILISLVIIGWNWFKLAGRGLF